MAELGWDTRYHLGQLQTLNDADSGVKDVAKVLHRRKPILEDMPIYPSDQIMSMTGLRESSLPTPTIIKPGQGHDATVAQWDPFVEDISMFKMRIDVPRDVLRIQNSPLTALSKIEERHTEGFGQGVENHIFFGSSVANPEKFDGLDVRYVTPDSTDPTNPTSADYGVYDMEGTGSTTGSVWLIQWGEGKVHGICPKNDPMMGLRRDDMGGDVYTLDSDSNELRTHRIELEWDLGLAISDYRCVARIRNISSTLDTTLANKIVEARNNMDDDAPVWLYCGPTIFTFLDQSTIARNNVFYDTNNPWGRPMLRFRDMPIRKSKALRMTETAVAAA